jgi:hypothetical protein
MTVKIATTAQAIPELLGWLRVSVPGTWRVLTAYLDTSPLRADRRAHLLAFRDGCKAIRPSLQAADVDRFEQAVRQAEEYLTRSSPAGPPGLALFASGEGDYFFAMPLPRRPAEEVAWGERPLLGPLEAILDECERIAVVLFDKARARIFTVHLATIEERRELHDEVPGKQATGGWFALAQSRYARHHEDHVLRHVRHITRELSQLLQTRPFEHLLIGGPDEALALLRSHLPRPLRARLAGTIDVELFASDTTILQAALRAAEEIERRAELADVEALLEAASTPRVSLGLRATLAALDERRVYRLFLAEGFAGEVGDCPRCGLLVAGPGHCPRCGEPTQMIGDPGERLVDLAEQQGARVELVSGQAAALLAAYDWLGAWTRY